MKNKITFKNSKGGGDNVSRFNKLFLLIALLLIMVGFASPARAEESIADEVSTAYNDTPTARAGG